MTKEKAIKKIKSYLIDYLPIEDYEEAEEIIEALEQKSCNDAISKASVFEIMGNLMSIPYDFDRPINEKDVSESMDKIWALPAVFPTPKKGKWIDTDVTLLNRQGYFVYEVICSECNGISYFRRMGNQYIGANCCPSCGAEMESAE